MFDFLKKYKDIPRDPGTITYIGTLITGATVGSVVIVGTLTVAGLVGYVAVTLVTSWAIAALAGKPDLSNLSNLSARGLNVNVREPAAVSEMVYGEIRKGGTITYLNSYAWDNMRMDMIVVLAGHECESIGDIYIDDEKVELDADGFVTTAKWLGPISVVYPNGKPVIKITKFTGGAGQEAPRLGMIDGFQGGSLDYNQGATTEAFVGEGITYIYMQLTYDAEVFANGVPLFTAVVKGKKVYSHQTDSTAYSANAALVIRDYITSDLGLDDQKIDAVSFAANELICDEIEYLSYLDNNNVVNESNVTGSGNFIIGNYYKIKTVGNENWVAIGAASNTVDVEFKATGIGTNAGTGVALNGERKYEINGVLNSALSMNTILSTLCTACAASVFWGQGTWKIKVGYYSPSVKTFTLDDIISGLDITTRIPRRDNFNSVGGMFNDKRQKWTASDYPRVSNTIFRDLDDNGEENPIDINFPVTTSPSMAQRLAKLTLYKAREQIGLNLQMSIAAVNVQVGDTVSLIVDKYGWYSNDPKEFEVTGWAFTCSPEIGVVINLTLRETSENVYAWDGEEEIIIANNSNLPTITDQSELSLSLSTKADESNNNVSMQILLNVNAKSPSRVDLIEVSYKIPSTQDILNFGLYPVDATDNDIQIIIPNLADGSYEVYIRAKNHFGVWGDKISKVVTVDSSNYSAGAISTFDLEVLTFFTTAANYTYATNATGIAYYIVKHSGLESNAKWSGGRIINTAFANSTSFRVPTLNGTYMMRAYNALDIPSPLFASDVIAAANNPMDSSITTLNESGGGFAGQKTNCEVVNGELRLTSGSTWGIYYFDGIVQNTGGAKKIYDRSNIVFTRHVTGNDYFDTIQNDFNSVEGEMDDFTGVNSENDDVNVIFQRRFSQGVSYTNYKTLTVGSWFGAQGRYRIRLYSKLAGVTPSISLLNVEIGDAP